MVEKSLQLLAVVKAQLYGPPSGGAPWFGQVDDRRGTAVFDSSLLQDGVRVIVGRNISDDGVFWSGLAVVHQAQLSRFPEEIACERGYLVLKLVEVFRGLSFHKKSPHCSKCQLRHADISADGPRETDRKKTSKVTYCSAIACSNSLSKNPDLSFYKFPKPGQKNTEEQLKR
ncbi:hypothetical protein CAPTEDRAFT_185600 [Capitella teleta]|uniref:Uncharacterized protein n=1 Tax=Capitella teleta TaxID=283909 RepID=R7VAA6_CAPTE|nr:hypothetical protein CAPTEDRAFT_185600 [Capitella teleta]|eukprot:ELU12645.1 hypothetical protein CAPTEDRAFT_185600 [Capitella teleta]